MKAIAMFLAVTVTLFCGFSGAIAGEAAPQKVVDLANGKLLQLASDPAIIAAVKAENAKGKTLDEIKAMDEKWRNTAGVADYMKAQMDSECGKHLRALQDKHGYFAEIFVMDNQGANVAMTDKTSDYWQGDEAKFKESFKGGAGGIHIGDVEFDDSAQAYLVQVSVSVKDGDSVIGAVTFGVDVDRVE